MLECMRKRKKFHFLRHFYIWTRLKNKKHTPFFPGLHTMARQLAYLRLAIFKHTPMAISHPIPTFKDFPAYVDLFVHYLG